MFSIRSVWRRQQLWGDGPVRWLTTTIFHTAATVTISLAAPTYGSMQMGHGELRRRFRWGRVGGGGDRNIKKSPRSHEEENPKWYSQESHFSHKPRLDSRRLPLTDRRLILSIIHPNISRRGSIAHLITRSPLPILPFPRQPRRSRTWREQICACPAVPVSLVDDAAALLVSLSSLDWHPHIFIRNASPDKLELRDKLRSSASLSRLFAQLNTYRSGGAHFYGNPSP